MNQLAASDAGENLCYSTRTALIYMTNGDLSWLTNFIWGIADDVLRDLYVRGKYRDAILPMTVIRRLDGALESTKQAVVDMKVNLDKAGITNQDAALRQASGQAFSNTSKFMLRDLRSRASQQQLRNQLGLGSYKSAWLLCALNASGDLCAQARPCPNWLVR